MPFARVSIAPTGAPAVVIDASYVYASMASTQGYFAVYGTPYGLTYGETPKFGFPVSPTMGKVEVNVGPITFTSDPDEAGQSTTGVQGNLNVRGGPAFGTGAFQAEGVVTNAQRGHPPSLSN